MCKIYKLLALNKPNIGIPKATILVKIVEGSCEIKGINSIRKPKIVFHKYANNVRNIPISSGSQTGSIKKKKKGRGKT